MKKRVAVGILFLCACGMFAQKTKVQQGDFEFLKRQSEINVEFVYDNLKLFKENKTNEEYMSEKVAELEAEEKGSGIAWKQKWMSSRESIYERKFLELLNEDMKQKTGLVFGKNLSNAPITLIVETLWVYPGWNVVAMKKKAKVTTMLTFVKTGNPDQVLLQILSEEAPGKQYWGAYNDWDRIGEGYAKTGKELNKMVRKEAF
ncbi:MAG TPA: hypothetical protein VFM65_04265 [Flavobacteriaceae bacterium]|nr:hypothetical protein [Flavobacteriaceae bacterium]